MQFYRIDTDDTLRETVQHGSDDFHFAYYVDDIWKYDFHYIDWHWHYEFEIVTATSGSVICLIGTEEVILEEGNSLLINSGVMHRFETRDGAIMPNIVFYPSLLAPEETRIYEKYIRPFIESSLTYQVFTPEVPWQEQILQILYPLYRYLDGSEISEFYILKQLLQLWDVLLKHAKIPTPIASEKDSASRQYKIQTMIQFIHDHYQEELSLADIASAATISKSSALQLFKKGIHVSPVEYLIQYRLSMAAILLRTTKQPVSVIAQNTGFQDSSYFCRKFKKFYQMRPGEYRQSKDSST
ncbi:AraC-like DNA-binding protein [Lachnospiraceae bacterium PF1-21]|uniref:AraC family transcriptional regulator n=1 Tax=Ohessyouella blattaphilus TaxID=2949333 RepID=A0ABT1EJ96_9FIRM|nr:AraC family transcriptional regulator [Ohessyouella blattaphilus]MCP1110765.1 AraC family transcriptional regulator [Ohessyouella blattaphilus]MCR8564159.1 AraC family transcriptional regulator [Ohessyouella blattaphilus]MDL2250026.1 AraC family transcriptional regulator [Lachnospiraceae bacterium OttesenSCG-928-J05]